MGESPGSLFCFGLGYSARVLGRGLSAEGWSVAGTTRDAVSAAGDADGFDVYHFDEGRSLDEAGLVALAAASHILSSVPPGADGDPVLARHGAAVAEAPGRPWVGYLSTTGVYGDWGGGWVDEDSDLRPTSERSRRRVAAEAAWLTSVPVHIFRLAGIYGPGRSPFGRIRAGAAQRVIKPGHRFGRIHVDDIATVLRASMARPRPGAVYNVCDDMPAEPAEVTAFACGLLGVDPPPGIDFEAAERTMSPIALSFWRDNRRVRNRRIKEELGVRLAYPDYRSGLQAVLAVESC